MKPLISIWRFSHFTLAISAGLFILLASLTGIILAFEPLTVAFQSPNLQATDTRSLSEFLSLCLPRHNEVLDLEVDSHNRIKATVLNEAANRSGEFFLDPKTGDIEALTGTPSELFSFVTNLHRSLFLKTPGRLLVGIASLALFFTCISGLLLLIGRQGSPMKAFQKIHNDDQLPYLHVISSRILLLPILIISLTGVYLSVHRFGILDSTRQKAETYSPRIDNSDLSIIHFDIFKQTRLKKIQRLEFPFSPDDEDYFILALQNKELKIHQRTGQIMEETIYPMNQQLHILSFNLHTGVGNPILALLLLLVAIGIIYLLYTGLRISARRRSKPVVSSITDLVTCEHIILVGSESGNTYPFVKALLAALESEGRVAGIGDLNDYGQFPKMKQLFIITSTYGDGDAPGNADKFLSLLANVKQNQDFDYAIVGFGSMAYEHFCGFAKTIDQQMQSLGAAKPLLESCYIHNRSYPDFVKWSNRLSSALGYRLALPPSLDSEPIELKDFIVKAKTNVQDEYDETFTLALMPADDIRVRSGDLLSIIPPGDSMPRQYSIGADSAGNILLSIKRHELGLCSNYLNELQVDDQLQAGYETNSGFHFPQQAGSVTLIANGTGMAPFIGMINQNTKQIPLYLYWGGRTKQAYSLYAPIIDEATRNEQIKSIQFAFSRESALPRQYVQDIINLDGEHIINRLDNRGIIMICGSIAMQKGVLEVLEKACESNGAQSLNHYIKMKRIRMDCY